jgi:nicotinate phosphoribosyltransferase
MSLLWKQDAPIFTSLYETDVYKILMQNSIFRYNTNLRATFSFINRTDVDLMRYVDIGQLNEELAHVASLRYREDEISHLMSWGMFQSAFPKNLRELKLEMPDVAKTAAGALVVEAGGLWSHSSPWEIPTLAIIAELYGRGRAKEEGHTEADLYRHGMERLMEKVAFFKAHPYLRGSQFGLRRRFSSLWERKITEVLLSETSFLTGVSNVWLARELGVEAQGTNAHELPMAAYAYARSKSNFDARNSVYKVLSDWQELYGQKALIMLPDAYGTDAFLRKLPDNFAYDWRGFRQDSGDAVAFGEKIIAFYESFGNIDPREKLIIFSDGLNKEKMLELYQHFNGRINVAFGVGTDLTNDMGLIKALSLVMKLSSVNGLPTVKLSDNIAKATGDREEIEVAKRIFGYTSTFSEKPVY